MSFSSDQSEYVFKIIVVGESGVGKSSLVLRSTDDIFSKDQPSTLGVDFKLKTLRSKNFQKLFRLQIWDSAGQERFRAITRAYYKGAHGVVVVYDISNHQSFEKVREWIQEVRDYGLDDIAFALVGNKNDLVAKKKVSTGEAKKLADELGLIFFETSAKDTSGINTVFSLLADSIYENILDGATNQTDDINIKTPKRKYSMETVKLSFDVRIGKGKKTQCCNV